MSMNVSLPHDLMEYVKRLVAQGRYSSESEMVLDALRQHKEFEAMRVRTREELARDVELGWRDFDAGRVTDFDPQAIKDAGRDRLARKNA